MTSASTYSSAHRCLKRHGLKFVGRVQLCAHHRRMKQPPLAPAAGRPADKIR